MRCTFQTGLMLVLASGLALGARASAWKLTPQDAPRLELVMQLVVTCSNPTPIGGGENSKDGTRKEVWPIIGGRFEGKAIKGTVIAGGGDFPVQRPDGVELIDALYRLRTDDGVTIIIHNKGLAYPSDGKDDWHYRLSPEFIAPVGKYQWLNSHLFIANLLDVPDSMRLAKGADENDRLIQVYEVL